MKRVLLYCLFLLLYVLNSFNPNMMEQYFKFAHYNIFGTILRFILSFSFILMPLALMYKNKSAKSIISFLVFPSSTLSLIFISDIVFHVKHKIYFIIIYVLLIFLIITYSLYLIYKKEVSLTKNIFKLLFTTFILSLPLNLLMNIKDHKFLMYRMFQSWYFVFLILFILSAVIIYYYLKNKSKEKQELVLFILSITLLYHLLCRFSFVRLHHYQDINDVFGALPLYVCSFGIVLLPFSICSKNKLLQTFSFLINTPGSIIVFVNPTMGVANIFNYDVTYFIYTHLGLFAVASMLPIYLYAKLDLKLVTTSCLCMFAYFFIVLGLDFIFFKICHKNYNFSFVAVPPLPVDVKHFGLLNLKGYKFSPLYILILWAIHSLMAFVTFYVYDFFVLKNKKPINF